MMRFTMLPWYMNCTLLTTSLICQAVDHRVNSLAAQVWCVYSRTILLAIATTDSNCFMLSTAFYKLQFPALIIQK